VCFAWLGSRYKHGRKTNPDCINALFAWAVEGCLRWQDEKKLKPPQLVKDKTTELRASFNPLLEFFEECCEFGLGVFKTPAGELRETYEGWANECRRKAD
jgi:phage/plasmid-associated DNA primase